MKKNKEELIKVRIFEEKEELYKRFRDLKRVIKLKRSLYGKKIKGESGQA